MTTTYRDYVVCGEHVLLHSAAGRCPDCKGTGPSGVDYSSTQKVTIVPTRSRADGGAD
jgi:hypothetical protein